MYKCPKCRNCKDCRKGDVFEQISIKEEAEQLEINESLEINENLKRIVANFRGDVTQKQSSPTIKE